MFVAVLFARSFEHFVTVWLIFWIYGCYGELEDVTFSVYGKENGGILSAFGDFNADKLTDVFVIKRSDDGKHDYVQLYLANNDEPYLRPSTKCDINFKEGNVTSVVPGDFDGDSAMDALVTFQGYGEDFTNIFILWGNLHILNCSTNDENNIVAKSKGQPTILDYNGDRIPDLLIESHRNSSREILLMSKTRNVTVVTLSGTNNTAPFKKPHSNAFADLNGDATADLVITSTSGLEIWLANDGGNFAPDETISWPPGGNVRIGQIALLDLDLDGKMDIVVPVCFQLETTCRNSSILLLRNSTWVPLFTDFNSGDNILWGVVPEISTMTTFTLRVGDFNSDGYPDIITVLENTKDRTDRRAFIFQNVPSNDGRTFEALWHLEGLRDVRGVTLAAFYDFFNDGILDVFLVSEKAKGVWEMNAFVNKFANDACFIKIIVLSGLCYRDCPLGNIPYGANQPGPSICYKTTWHDGSSQFSCATQLSQSAHFALQLPYVVFGLGPTPNFVDVLKVGIPRPRGQAVRQHEWTAIIPNSQMFVIPHLESSGNRWYNKLFVTPSHLVLLTFAALMGSMLFIAVIVLGLHLKEKREDKQAKLQESYRFHFDAL